MVTSVAETLYSYVIHVLKESRTWVLVVLNQRRVQIKVKTLYALHPYITRQLYYTQTGYICPEDVLDKNVKK